MTSVSYLTYTKNIPKASCGKVLRKWGRVMSVRQCREIWMDRQFATPFKGGEAADRAPVRQIGPSVGER